jgi:hypothetical protein
MVSILVLKCSFINTILFLYNVNVSGFILLIAVSRAASAASSFSLIPGTISVTSRLASSKLALTASTPDARGGDGDGVERPDADDGVGEDGTDGVDGPDGVREDGTDGVGGGEGDFLPKNEPNENIPPLFVLFLVRRLALLFRFVRRFRRLVRWRNLLRNLNLYFLVAII